MREDAPLEIKRINKNTVSFEAEGSNMKTICHISIKDLTEILSDLGLYIEYKGNK